MAKTRTKIRTSTASKIFDVLNVVFMIVFAFIMIYPFWNQLIISFNEGSDTVKGGLSFWPRAFTFSNYTYIFERSSIGKGAVISVLRAFVGTAITVFCSGLLAYVTTIKHFIGRHFMRLVFVITMYFGGGLIPTYLLFTQLGLTETFTVYWLPQLFSAYYMILISSFIAGLPDALAESARLDGASEMTIYFRIILPLCKPVIAAISVMLAVQHWNSWFDVMLYNSSGKWDTLQVYLRKILLENEQAARLLSEQKQYEFMKNLTTASIRAATTMIVTIPIVCVYPFFQKYFVGGITIGAVKG